MEETMKTLKLITIVGLLSVGVVSAVPASSQPRQRLAAAASSTQFKWGASIIPSNHFAIGNSLPSGTDGTAAGAAFTANGVGNYDTTCNKCSYDFMFFVFTNEPQKAAIVFRVISPTGTTVFTNTWSSTNLPIGTSWFYSFAKGNFSAPGTYWAEVYGTVSNKSTLIGAIPLPFAPPK
jgi:hypothetical protein